MRAYDLIKTKRDGNRLSEDAISWLIEGYTDGRIPDYQMSAMLMAIFLRGLDKDELTAWARAMLYSGEVVDLGHVKGVKVDKHSTGGVGDKVSLCLAPLVAACGVPVPMISGRGLGHTGGTLDKLESIPGFDVRLSTAAYRNIVAQHGLCLIGQTPTLAPADRKLYSLRDVTATVDSLPLIASSIMSKKLAEGIDALVLDVKTGSGAFMKSLDDSRALARTMVEIGQGMDKQICALITDMNQPLGEAVGNANELIEAIEILKGRGPADLKELTLALGVEMMLFGGAATDDAGARAKMQAAIDDGSALETFERLIVAQHGDAGVLEDYSRLPSAKGDHPVSAGQTGYIAAVNNEEVGIAGMVLGAGRETVESEIDHGVGITIHKRIGDRVEPDEPIATLHYNDDSRLDEAAQRLRSAYQLSDEAAEPPPLVYERIG